MRFGEFAETFVEVMAIVAPNVPVHVGERHMVEQSGPSRVWIAPFGRCSWGRPTKVSAGQMFEIKLGVIVRVWGAETVSDVDRWEAADDLAEIVLNVVDRVDPSRAEPVDMSRPDASVQTFGEQYAFGFTLSRGVPKIRKIATLALLPLELASPPNPLNPDNELGTVTVTLTDNVEG